MRLTKKRALAEQLLLGLYTLCMCHRVTDEMQKTKAITFHCQLSQKQFSSTMLCQDEGAVIRDWLNQAADDRLCFSFVTLPS